LLSLNFSFGFAAGTKLTTKVWIVITTWCKGCTISPLILWRLIH
jgi:hypothetical protein